MHHSYELITILSGSMTVNISEHAYELKAGESVLIFPEQIHSLSSTSSRHMLVIFSPDIIGAYNLQHISEIPKNNKITIPEYIKNQLVTLEGTDSIIKIKAVFYAICDMLDESTSYIKKRSSKEGLLHSVFDFVERNYYKECDLGTLAAALGYNSAYLSRYFSETTGISYKSYLNRYKISMACYILKNTDKTILECAYECGYTSLRNFNRNFKSIIGSPPSEYRLKK